MAYASKAGRARVSAKKPEALGVCDRCGIWHQLDQLIWQFAWRGTALVNIWIRVCQRCLDVPTEQLRAIQLPADPVPVWQPRVEAFVEDETNYRTVIPGCPGTPDPITGIPRPSTTKRITEDRQFRITQNIGSPTGFDLNAVMPYNGAIQKHFARPLSPLSITSNGTTVISVTFSQAHGLCTNDQIAVEGLANSLAAGLFSVVVISPMALTYETYSDVPSGGLLTGTTRMVTALVGLPYETVRIPQVGP